MNGKGLISIKAKASDSWVDLTPYLESFTPGDGDLATSDSGRTLKGTMYNNVTASKEYYDLVFVNLPWNTASTILSIVRGRNSVLMKYPSPLVAGELTTKSFYVQDRSMGSPIFQKEKANPNTSTSFTVLWPDITFRLAEI